MIDLGYLSRRDSTLSSAHFGRVRQSMLNGIVFGWRLGSGKHQLTQ